MRRVILTADDFGLSEAVNEGVERAHREGVLTAASLMVAGHAARDAVQRARRMPGLRVGLHLVVVEGAAILPTNEIDALVDAHGGFSGNQFRLGLRYAFNPDARRQLEAEIRAQFAAFKATGLTLDHADAHKHMHLHPVVGAALLRVGKEFGLRAVRVPTEPAGVMFRAGARGGRALAAWSRLFRRQARRAGMIVTDHVFGLAWTGRMTEDKLLRLIPLLPEGVSEIYFHPATRRDRRLEALMPEYEHEAELEALLSRRVRGALRDQRIQRVAFGDLP